MGVGDFEAAISHFIQASSPPQQVLALFPAFLPPKLPLPPSSSRGAAASAGGAGGGFASAAAKTRAAAAVVRYLENQRPATHGAADDVERKRRRATGGLGAGDDDRAANTAGGKVGDAAGYRRALRGVTEEEEEEEALQVAVMVDTVLLVGRLACTPPRRWDVVDLLSRPNRCHEASCLPLLAERGVGYAEALLWLYRSVGAHERALANLTEDKCVSGDSPECWTLDQYQRWTGDYLRTLWRSRNPSEVRLVVASPRTGGAAKGGDSAEASPAVSLLRAAPLLGLKVFLPDSDPASPADIRSKQGRATLAASSLSSAAAAEEEGGLAPGALPAAAGGMGFTVKEVVDIMRRITPDSTHASAAPATVGEAPVVPVSCKRGLAVAYLEGLIGSGLCPAQGHDELGLLLVEGFQEPDAAPALRAAFGAKLRAFLLTSKLYDPTRMLATLPPAGASHEKALVLSRLGRHLEVLRLYVHECKDVPMAEGYCRRIHAEALAAVAQQEQAAAPDDGEQARLVSAASDVYLELLKVARAVSLWALRGLWEGGVPYFLCVCFLEGDEVVCVGGAIVRGCDRAARCVLPVLLCVVALRCTWTTSGRWAAWRTCARWRASSTGTSRGSTPSRCLPASRQPRPSPRWRRT